MVGALAGGQEGGASRVGTRVLANESEGGGKVFVQGVASRECREGGRGGEGGYRRTEGGEEGIQGWGWVARGVYSWSTDGGGGGKEGETGRPVVGSAAAGPPGEGMGGDTGWPEKEGEVYAVCTAGGSGEGGRTGLGGPGVGGMAGSAPGGGGSFGSCPSAE